MQVACDCSNCGLDSRSRRREFTEQTWSVLLAWNEVNKTAVDQPICDDCYEELREILIDRADEVALAISQPEVFAARALEAAKAAKARAKKAGATAKPKKKTVAKVIPVTAKSKSKTTTKKKKAAASAKKAPAKKTVAKKAKKVSASGKKKSAAKKTKRSSRLAS